MHVCDVRAVGVVRNAARAGEGRKGWPGRSTSEHRWDDPTRLPGGARSRGSAAAVRSTTMGVARVRPPSGRTGPRSTAMDFDPTDEQREIERAVAAVCARFDLDY